MNNGVIKGNLAEKFEEQAAPAPVPPPVMEPETYRLLLEKLLAQGQGCGKTQPVAAYLLTNIRATPDPNKSDQDIEVRPKYVVMDIALRPLEYSRRLEMDAIMRAYASRRVGEGDLNGADFEGPGVWTNTVKSFEFDYIRREGLNEYGKPTNIWDPNPDAHRIYLDIDDPITIPVEWGTYFINTGGALAIRERDAPALTEALQSIRDGKESALHALYKKNADGKLISRFDIYGMEPEFRKDNYDPVDLSELSKGFAAQFSTPAPAVIPPHAEEPMAPELEQTLAKYTFDDTPEDGAVFWCEGGKISTPEDRKTVSVNDELVQGFMRANNYMQRREAYADMLHIVDPYFRFGRNSSRLSWYARDVSHFEEKEFHHRLSVRFARSARGTIHVAAANGIANSNFRLFEYPAIMDNKKIVHVQMIEGQPTPAHASPRVNLLTGTFERTADILAWKEDEKRYGKENLKYVGADMIFNENLRIMPKTEWSDQQKQEWLDASWATLLRHLNNEPEIPEIVISGVYYADATNSDMYYAQARFLGEIIFSLRESDRLCRKVAQGNIDVALQLENERLRLLQIHRILEQYPQILFFDEPATDLEYARSWTARYWKEKHQCPRRNILTQKLGDMLLKLDDLLSMDQKNHLWGRYTDYDRKDHIDELIKYMGKPEEVEDYIRIRLAELKNQVWNAIKQIEPQPAGEYMTQSHTQSHTPPAP